MDAATSAKLRRNRQTIGGSFFGKL